MLNNTPTFSSFSVNDLNKARDFYKNTLGLKVEDIPGTDTSFFLHTEGNKKNMVYLKPDHTPATFTVLNFQVDDVNKAVNDLNGLGVNFEHYDGELRTDDKGIARRGNFGAAWFKDPAGNILSVMEYKP